MYTLLSKTPYIADTELTVIEFKSQGWVLTLFGSTYTKKLRVRMKFMFADIIIKNEGETFQRDLHLSDGKIPGALDQVWFLLW